MLEFSKRRMVMPTVKDILRIMEFNRSYGLPDEGSCFGVTDPSRLRPAFYRKIRTENLCASCGNGEHQCAGKLYVLTIEHVTSPETGEPLLRKSSAEVSCQCETCHKKE